MLIPRFSLVLSVSSPYLTKELRTGKSVGILHIEFPYELKIKLRDRGVSLEGYGHVFWLNIIRRLPIHYGEKIIEMKNLFSILRPLGSEDIYIKVHFIPLDKEFSPLTLKPMAGVLKSSAQPYSLHIRDDLTLDHYGAGVLIETKEVDLLKSFKDKITYVVLTPISIVDITLNKEYFIANEEWKGPFIEEKVYVPCPVCVTKNKEHYQVCFIVKDPVYEALTKLVTLKGFSNLCAYLNNVIACFSKGIEEYVVRKERELPRDLLLSPSREVLESLTAEVLKTLGFFVKVDARLPSKVGGDIEVDVWGEKIVAGSRFSVYVSCKNWNRKVDRPVIDEEFGRVMNLRKTPHLKILIAKELTSSAKQTAEADGFFVIELGEKVTKENSYEIYRLISSKLNDLFTGIAPPYLQKLAKEVKEVTEKLREIARELESLSSGT